MKELRADRYQCCMSTLLALLLCTLVSQGLAKELTGQDGLLQLECTTQVCP